MSHAYTILNAFTIVDNGITWKLLLARNPWGITTYVGDWDYSDSRWTQENLDKVPNNMGSKVKTKNNYDGLFVIPVDKLIYS